MKKSIPNEVFHYTNKDVALEKILFEKKIRLGKIGYTNDPRESKERMFSVTYNAPSSRSYPAMDRLIKIFNEANFLIANEWKVFCVSQHHPEHDLHLGETTYPFFRGDCRPRMWATYAENHKGVCLKFNGSKFDQRLRKELGGKHKIFCGPVTYDDFKSMVLSSPIDLKDINISKINSQKVFRDYFTEFWEELFLVKSKDWETEFEYRWLVNSISKFPEYVSIDGVLEGVLVGQDFPEAYFPSLIKLCQELKIPAGIVKWHGGKPYRHDEEIYKP